jgi:glucokinase
MNMARFSIGVDLGGTNLRIAVVDSDGRLLEKVTTGTEVARGRNSVIDAMCAAIRNLSLKYKVAGTLAGIGVGVPGIIDLQTGMLRESPNLPGWQDYPVREEIENRLGTKVTLENDANAAALGEKWLGAGAAFNDMCMLTLGTGVGGGLILNGRIWHGMRGMAAELGHINVDPDGVACGCGSRGCLEQYASATAVKRLAMEAIAGGNAPELAQAINSDPEFNAKAVYRLATAGDKTARAIFHRVGSALGIGVADLINIFDMPMYVIGGGVAAAWDAFAPVMLETAAKYSYIYRVTTHEPETSGHTSQRKTVITHALLGSDAGLIGAARLGMIEKQQAVGS